jgi:hypothetical protein
VYIPYMARKKKIRPATVTLHIQIPPIFGDLRVTVIDGTNYTQVLVPPSVKIDHLLLQFVKNYLKTYYPHLTAKDQDLERAIQVSHPTPQPTKS